MALGDPVALRYTGTNHDPQALSEAVLKRSLPALLLISLGLTVILGTLAWPRIAPQASNQAKIGSLPQQLAGQALPTQMNGAEALAEIESLHGKGFALTGGTVAHYGQATVWLAQAQDEPAAQAMAEAMTRRIADGGSPFTPTGTRHVGGHTILTLTGMGQSHFYWQSGTRVIWLAIPPAQADLGLRELVSALNQN